MNGNWEPARKAHSWAALQTSGAEALGCSPNGPPSDLDEMWYIYTMEYYSAIKRNKIEPFADTWVDLETIMKSEVSQKDKSKYHVILLLCGI